MSGYNYHILNSDEIRLVRLDPGHYKDKLVCKIIHTSLKSHTIEYEALSYVWENSSDPWTAEYNWAPPEGLFVFYPPPPDDDTKDGEKYGVDLGEGRIIPTRPQGQIECDGQEITIGSELYDALRRLRLPDRERQIWIDAICINQNDISERGSQVAIMGQIYTNATRVLIWTGEHFSAGPASQAMFDFISQLEYLITMIMYQYGPRDRKSINLAIRNGYISHSLSFSFLRVLLARAWFGRVWVLQEVANAKKATIFAGSGQCDWDTICSITRWLSKYDINGPLNMRGTICAIPVMDMTWDLSRRKEDPRKPSPPRLLDVLAGSRLCKSTYAIDKVYGVIGLACKEDREKIEINYRVSAADVYKKVAILELFRIGLDILYFCTKSAKKSVVTCPSWVPDWSQPCYHVSYFKLGYKCAAAGTSCAKFRIEGNTLVVRGRFVDSIEVVELTRRISEAEISKETETDAKESENYKELEVSQTPRDSKERGEVKLPPNFEMKQYNASVPDEDSMDIKVFEEAKWLPNMMKVAFPDGKITSAAYEALWRTCCCNRTAEGNPPNTAFAESFSAWTKAMGGLKLGDYEDFQVKGKSFMDSFTKHCDNRRFFRTSKGRFGWGPDQMRDGDVVCIFDGAAVPLVLRPVLAGQFEVVGDAYVHGIMDGEAMKLGLEAKEICLI
ncbi:hypothetical protein G7Y89_g12730 [Cudoniella acicularis]|uniref:Heterokaryon incompatibility domain-containing protein n=1 Tax=Cudoniella acicularis TaxID=354080 RepID=A0A8H4R9V1_9HELO|nr:hypothetical protein G7Y89_g12730 [Cudoniella acicularis]